MPLESKVQTGLSPVLPETWTKLKELMQEEERHILSDTSKDD